MELYVKANIISPYTLYSFPTQDKASEIENTIHYN